MPISSTPSHSEVQNEFSNGNESTSLETMITNVFGGGYGSLKDFAGLGKPTCTTTGYNSVDSDSAIITGSVDFGGGSNSITCNYRFKLDDGTTSQITAKTGNDIEGNKSQIFGGLSSDTTYVAQIQVKNPFSNWVSGGTTTFTTDAGLPYNLYINWTQQDFMASANAHWTNADTSTSIEFQAEIGNNGWGNTQVLSAGTTSNYAYTSLGEGGYTRFRVRYNGQTQWAVSSTSTSPGGDGGGGGGGGGSCFVAGTPVTIYDGSQALIENLDVGDKILAADIEGFQDTNDPRQLYKWRGNRINKGDVPTTIKEIKPSIMPSTVIVNGGELEASNPHSQLIKRAGEWKFIPLENLKEGDVLIKHNGKEVEVKSLVYKQSSTTVYEMTLEEPYHTFYANDILTHNIKIT